jgi:NAD(P)H-hydrate epimerase
VPAGALLTCAQMARADALAAASGVPGTVLMAAAGRAVADAVAERWPAGPVSVLCGPGNNGGDGFVAARRLADAGWPVRVALLGDRAALAGDAAWASGLWRGPVEPLSPAAVEGASLVVDALFGAGLSRPLPPEAAAVLRAARAPVVAVDVPSGVHGDTGDDLGGAVPCELTVTFFLKKPGHLLAPGRFLCGEVVVADIGIPAAVLEEVGPRAWENTPSFWRHLLPRPRPQDHKYTRGHAVVVGGPAMTGAARLAARAAQRAGAGLVTLAAPEPAVPVYAAALEAALVRPLRGPASLARLLRDRRLGPVVIGPGLGRGPMTRLLVEAAAGAGCGLVLDADALTAFAGDAAGLAGLLRGRDAVLTPHPGEFRALFGARDGDRLTLARAAAAEAGAVVLLKGPDTVVAAPDGRAVVNAGAPPRLATAGSGDVLAGLVGGLMAQGAPAFEAAAAGAWLHGAAARAAADGMTASDLPDLLPAAAAAAESGIDSGADVC